MAWKQFSLYPALCRNKFQPQQVLHSFLPRFMEIEEIKRWYVLFEPSALVRFEAEGWGRVIQEATGLASMCGLELEMGDCSSDWTGAEHVGEDCVDESQSTYGLPQYGPKVWDALKVYMQACSELSVEIVKLDYSEQITMARKMLHLALNSLGMTYLEEHAMATLHAERSLELSKKYWRM